LLVLTLGGVLLGLGSGAFASANWAATTDAVTTRNAGRALGLASVATWAAAAGAGLLGPLIDIGNAISAGAGYVALLGLSGLLFLVCVPLALVRDRDGRADALVPAMR
jgi:MFS family permease